MINRYLVLSTVAVLFLIAQVAVYGQNSDKEPLYFQTYTIEDGLSDNWIRDVTQDQQGYIWITTASGVSNFDGYDFENYFNEPGNISSLSSNDAQNVLVDKENNVWVGTASGLNRFDRAGGTFQRFQNDPNDSTSLPGNTIFELHESRSGTLWVLTDQGLAAFKRDSQTFEVVSTESGNKNESRATNLKCISESSDGRIWIGTEGEGIKILNPDTREVSSLRHNPADENSLPADFVENLFIDKEEVLWVNYDLGGIDDDDFIPEGSTTGLWKKILSTGEVYHYRYKPEPEDHLFGNLSDFEQTKDGKLWFSRRSGTEGGLYVFNREKNSFDKYVYEVNNPGTIAWNFVTAVFEDRFSNLWVATSRGLSRTNRSRIRINSFTPDTTDKYGVLNNFYGISEVSDNRFWISPDGGTDVLDWNRNTNTWEVLSDLKLGVRRLPVLPDEANHVWLANWPNSIQRLNLQTLEKTSFELNSGSDGVIFINHFILLQDGNLLVATDRGLWKLDIGSGRYAKVEVTAPFGNNTELDIEYLVSEQTGAVWLAANNTSLSASGSVTGILLAKYHPETGLTEFPEIDEAYLKNFGNETANSMSLDSNGGLWVSKNNGLVRYKPESEDMTTYNRNNGLRHSFVLGSLEDDDGMIWVVTNFSVSRLNPSTGAIRNFGSTDGLRPVRMNNYSFFKRKNGELMFGGVGGLSFFHPGEIKETQKPPLIHLVKFETEDSIVNLTGSFSLANPIKIDRASNSINVEYVSVSFDGTKEMTYSYKLEGFHDDWVNAGTRRFAQFSNLPPKNYTFLVRAVNADGISSKEAASVSFAVLPPWWRTWWAYTLYFILLILGIMVANRVQSRKVQQREREKVREKELAQAKKVEQAYQNLEVAHESLKSTQAQLIQSEKMASLGELTAGIAHEIQNPLNFVNNFSEVSQELIDEMAEEIEKGDLEEIKELSTDIKGNLEKITHHGKRADAIVKGMLAHSRSGKGEKVPTDLNALAEEYLKLSYHGLRAKDKSFNADFKTDFDPNLPKVNVVPQDIGRVLLNLINNAFQAVNERSKKEDSDYLPKVTVTTQLTANGQQLIAISDNGPGIPHDIKDKIFQPFFTTKPTGQGTGLGLSLSYDIVKAHGGELKVVSNEADGTKFTIHIPT